MSDHSDEILVLFASRECNTYCCKYVNIDRKIFYSILQSRLNGELMDMKICLDRR